MFAGFLRRQGAEPAAGGVRLEGTRKSALDIGRTRLIVTGALFFVAYGVIAGRMVDVMLLKGGEAPQAARPSVAVRMERADILDRNGVLLATSLPTVSLYANPHEVLDADEAAAKLIRALPELSHAEVMARLTADRSFVYLKRNLTPGQQFAVNALGIPGLYFQKGERRVYPQGALVSHVVGMTDVDNRGIAGVERTFDDSLAGAAKPLKLSIDLRVQAVLRAELMRAVHDFRAIGATGAVLDVRSGELLAMVSLPDFDPNLPSGAAPEALFNRATLGVYEMGSTFKLFNTAAALDAGAIGMGDSFDATKPINIARFRITDYKPQNRWLTVPEILVHSSNIGSARIALDMGTEAQREFLGRLGMLRPAAIELPEVGSPLVPSPWREINTMTISYGHGLAVTPLHLVAGVAALVNGGTWRQATLVRREAEDPPAPARQVLNERTSRQMRELMRMVVADGTGGKAEAAGYRVGGKTGTAEKSAAGGYRRKALLSSFVGAFPMHDPRYVVLAMIDEPQGTKETFGYATGGWTAAPVIGRVVAQIGPMLGIAPVIDAPTDAVRQASSKGARLAAAR